MKYKEALRDELQFYKKQAKAAEHELAIVKIIAGIRKAKVCDNFIDAWVARAMHTENQIKETILEGYNSNNELQILSDRISGQIVEVISDSDCDYFELKDNNFVIHDSMIEFI